MHLASEVWGSLDRLSLVGLKLWDLVLSLGSTGIELIVRTPSLYHRIVRYRGKKIKTHTFGVRDVVSVVVV